MTNSVRRRGVLHPDSAATKFQLSRHAATGEVARFVEYYWIVRWDLRGEPPHEQRVLSHPNVHLAFEEPDPAVYGVVRGVFVRRIAGVGHVLGVRFRPGGFRPFIGRPVGELTDRVLPAVQLFGPAATETCRAILATTDEQAMVGHAEAFLTTVLPEPDPVFDEVAAIVTRIVTDPDLSRVEQVAEAFGLSVRRLQRLFADYVGASPKWVLRRARLHEATTRADSGHPIDWANLANELGYADQAHLIRDFTTVIGQPPARYQAS